MQCVAVAAMCDEVQRAMCNQQWYSGECCDSISGVSSKTCGGGSNQRPASTLDDRATGGRSIINPHSYTVQTPPQWKTPLTCIPRPKHAPMSVP